MGILQLSMFSLLADKMRWHQARQGVLAENVANAETPGFQARELKPFDLEVQKSRASLTPLTTAATEPGHFSVYNASSAGYPTTTDFGYEITPEGNGVTLEEQMTKVAENQLDYQTVTALYTRSVGIIKTALGRA
ncbi:MAG: flagellar basal body rod protein FlgB [Alphaproteobacteria bacterium]|nr:flagellar basal body rod protein FlgB [Alphaproteobacteria bacterium]